MPARRYIVSPQGAGGSALAFFGETLPSVAQGNPYSQNVATQASGGQPPYTFTMINQTGGDGFAVDPVTGVVTGTPNVQPLLVNENGVFLTTQTGAYLST